jgi:hypothetical protein
MALALLKNLPQVQLEAFLAKLDLSFIGTDNHNHHAHGKI